MGETLEALTDFFIMSELWGIQSQLERLREEQLLAASEIVASVESVTEAVEALRASVERQTMVLERGFTTLDARLDFQTHVLEKILTALYRPTETRARELRKLGEQLLHKKLYDDALRELLSSLELNPYDFTCQWMAALIQLEYLHDPQAAWDRCEFALKCVPLGSSGPLDPSPPYFASRSLVLMGQMLEDGGLLEDGLSYYEGACKTSPDYGECFRRYASVAIRLGHGDLAMAAIRAAILIDEAEAVLVHQDQTFSPIAEEVNALVASLRERAEKSASSLAAQAERAVAAYRQLVKKVTEGRVRSAWDDSRWEERDTYMPLLARDGALGQALARSSALLQRRSFLDATWARRNLFIIAAEVGWLIPRLRLFSHWALGVARDTSDNEFTSAGNRVEAEHRDAAAEYQRQGKMGPLFTLFTVLAILGAMVAISVAVAGRVGGQPTSGEWLLAAVGGGAAVVAYLVSLVFLEISRWEKKGSRQLSARKVLAEAQTARAATAASIRDAEAALDNLLKLQDSLAKTGKLLDDQDVTCDLVLLDPNAKADSYDEGRLASALQEIAGQRTLSREEAKAIIRDAPVVLVSGVSVSNAERAAARLRCEFGASIGIRRRYVGQFPPRVAPA